MKASERPPIKHKKGIQIVQPSHPHPKTSHHFKESETGSSRSMGRSRGISTSRESGIKIDKIYDPKHFLPPKSPQLSNAKSDCDEMKTLTSVRSLKLISVYADSNAESIPSTDNFKKTKGDVPNFEFHLKTEQSK